MEGFLNMLKNHVEKEEEEEEEEEEESSSSSFQVRYGWERNKKRNIILVLKTEEKVTKIKGGELVIYNNSSRRESMGNSRPREKTEEQYKKKKKGSSSHLAVMLCFFYIRIKNTQMTASSKENIPMIGVDKELMDTRSIISMDLVPNEIIQEEILIRLPLKTIMRSKCVSKDWNSFISDDYFRKRFHSRQQSMGNTPNGFICGTIVDHNVLQHGFCVADKFLYTSRNYTEKEELKSFTHLNTFGYVIAASKGLLLVGHSLENLCVYDLVSRNHVKISRNNLDGGECVALGFKCEEWTNGDNDHLCYKVVCVDNQGKDRHEFRSSYNVEIYSSETRTWQKSIMKSKMPFQIWSFHLAKVIRGVFHWHERCTKCFIAYDFEDPKGRVVIIELPRIDTRLDSEYLRHLEGTEDGSLRFFSIDNDNVLRVWIMKSTSGRSYMDENMVHSSRWDLAYSVSLCDIGIGSSGSFDLFERSCVAGSDPLDCHVIYLRVGTQLHAYNYHKRNFLFTFSQKIKLDTYVFTYFEWPTWPCL